MRQVSSRKYFPRPGSKLARFVLPRYVKWLEGFTFGLSILLIGGVIYSFVYLTDDTITAGGLQIKANETQIKAPDALVVVRLLKQPFDLVKVGDPLAVVCTDAKLLPYFTALASVSDPKSGLDVNSVSALTAELMKKTAGAKTITITSTANGVLVIPPDVMLKSVPKDGPLMAIDDPTHLYVEGSFKGDTVADARNGQAARLNGVQGPTGEVTTVLNFSKQGAKETMPSTYDAQILDPIHSELVGKPIAFLDDIPFKIDDVKSVQIAENITASSSASGRSEVVCQPLGIKVEGKVESGMHEAEVQVPGVSAQTFSSIDAVLRKALTGQTIDIEGSSLESTQPVSVDSIGSPSLVITVKASSSPTPETTQKLKEAARSLPQGSKVNRDFHARIAIASPPYLQQLYIACLKLGKPLTGDAEIVTGRRPLALQLLKR